MGSKVPTLEPQETSEILKYNRIHIKDLHICAAIMSNSIFDETFGAGVDQNDNLYTI